MAHSIVSCHQNFRFLFWHVFTALAALNVVEAFGGPISCPEPNPGWLPPGPLGQIYPIEYRTASLQEICTSLRTANGNYIGFFGRCVSDEEDGQYVVFRSIREAGWAAPNLATRFAYYCRTRCFCRELPGSGGEVLVQPKGYPTAYRQSILPVQETTQIRIEQHIPFTTISTAPDRMVIAEPIRMWVIQGRTPVILKPSQGEMISVHPSNLITCNQGPLPDINIPPPYRIEDFISRQDLCAISLSNGNIGANAGGYCHASRRAIFNPFRSSDEQYSVAFLDEMTPRQSWTWRGDFSAAARIRFFCWQNCWCSNHPNSKKMDKIKWGISKDAYITKAPDGKLHVTYKPKDAGFKTMIVQELGMVQTGHSQSSVSTCGQSCSGPAAQFCSDSTYEDGCRCVVSATAQVQQVGLDRVFDAACLVLASMAVQKHSSLGGRDISPDDMTERADIVCPCNSTYISRACCDSQSGLLWERDGEVVHGML